MIFGVGKWADELNFIDFDVGKWTDELNFIDFGVEKWADQLNFGVGKWFWYWKMS